LALAVVGGLTSSTVLSLFLVPVMFTFIAKREAIAADGHAIIVEAEPTNA
jgi:Cu/Ag efflux pump CusA